MYRSKIALHWQLHGCAIASYSTILDAPKCISIESIHPLNLEIGIEPSKLSNFSWVWWANFGKRLGEFSSSRPHATAGRAARVASHGPGAKVGRHRDRRCFGHRRWEEDCPGRRQGSKFTLTPADMFFVFEPGSLWCRQTWLENPRTEWRFLARKITYFYGPFSRKPCLITGGQVANTCGWLLTIWQVATDGWMEE